MAENNCRECLCNSCEHKQKISCKTMECKDCNNEWLVVKCPDWERVEKNHITIAPEHISETPVRPNPFTDED